MKINTNALFDELEKIAVAGPNGAKPGMSFHHWATAVFKPMKTKKAGIFKSPKADLAGLGMLGVPVAAKLMDSKASKKEKVMAGVEGAGLGTLAAHTIANMGKHAAPAMSSMMNMHRLADAAKAAKSAKLSGPSMIQGALRSNPNNIARATHLQGQTATGGLPFTPKKPIPL